MLLCMESGKQYEVDLLSATQMLAYVRNNTPPVVVANCFRHSDLVHGTADPGVVADEETGKEQDGHYVCIMPADVPLGDYFAIDSDVAMAGTVTDSDIVAEVLGGEGESADEDASDADEHKRPTMTDAAHALVILEDICMLFSGSMRELSRLQKFCKTKNIKAKIIAIQKRLNDLEQKSEVLEKVNEELSEVHASVNNLEARNFSLQTRLDGLEDRSRQNNLLFYGFPDCRETWQETEAKLTSEINNVETCGPLTDSEIVQMVRPHDCIPENDDDDDDIGNEPPPRAADVAAGLALAQRFFVGEHNAEEALRHVYFLQNLLAAARFGKQKKMTDYFSSKLSRF
ncbi:hypothetical protein HPB51_007819 [Rhipicephalus microplus]|uniref:Uncharacterized protein n=1 Tax=Rhipicephalus microplus TaxID=6941 RepID=A0A9J6EZ03_RHIMP|nr:hypothetical protein HPB51_007819 [Rhipicephalus microplus]